MSNIILIVVLTKLSAAVVDWPSNSDHMGIGLTAGQVLYGNLLVDLKTGAKIRWKISPEKTGREYLDQQQVIKICKRFPHSVGFQPLQIYGAYTDIKKRNVVLKCKQIPGVNRLNKKCCSSTVLKVLNTQSLSHVSGTSMSHVDIIYRKV